MSRRKTIISFLILSHLMIQGCHAACTVINRFIGKDSGIVLPVAFTYEVTVKAGTQQAVVKSTIIPTVERAFAAKGAQRLIVACAPAGTDTSKYSNIMGIDLDPRDTLMGPCNPKKANCYTVHSEATIYTRKTNKAAAQTFLIAMATVMQLKPFPNAAIVSLGNMKSAKALSGSDATATRLGAPTPAPGAQTIQEKIEILKRENQPAFIGMIVGIIVVGLLIIIGVSYGVYYCYTNRTMKK